MHQFVRSAADLCLSKESSTSSEVSTEKLSHIPIYFPVSMPKLILMSLCSFGIYSLYWFYKNWVYEKARTGDNISPFWRAVFSPFFSYSLFRRIKVFAEKSSISFRYPPSLLALGYLVLTVSERLPGLLWLISLFTFLPLIPVQRVIWAFNRKYAPQAESNSRLSAANIALLVVGGLMLLLAVWGSFIPKEAANLAQARQSFTTKLMRKERIGQPAPQPPPQLFRLVRYPSQEGDLVAYISPPPSDGKKHPAIIWIIGGFDNSIRDTFWKQAPPDNDQSARAFREAGIVMMCPSLRGGNDNPGFKEGFYGEVDDVIAAASFLDRQNYVDPDRIYLGGHSTGGTLALLVAESTDQFRAIFSFGPVDDVRWYVHWWGGESLPFDISDAREVELRAPIKWLQAIRRPTFVFEGAPGNIDALRRLSRATQNRLIYS